MTETPTAAVAAPVAPVAPVAAPAAPEAPVVAPAAVAAPAAAPAAPVATPVVPPPLESLLPAEPPAVAAAPQTEAEKIAAAKELIKQAEAAADPNSGKAWLLTDGVMGVGEKPSWFKGEKYKTVSAQAEAYTALESRFGAFVGAPKEGYKFTPPEGVDVNMDHPLMQEFTKWAKDSQLNQAGFENMLGMLVQYEAANAPRMADIKAKLGDKADERISAVAQWGKANLGPEGYSILREATAGKNADAVFKVLEQVIGKTAQVRMPKPGADVPGGVGGDGLDAIKAAHGAKMPDGKLRVNVDPAYRLEVDKRYREYFAARGQ